MHVSTFNLSGQVRARAPLRLGLAGGGTDVSPYSDIFGGYVLNATIDKYAFASISARNSGLSFTAADLGITWQGEAVPCVSMQSGLSLLIGVYNRIVKDFLQGHPIPINLVTYSEAPPGSGLGSSSTMVVAIVQAFAEYLMLPLGEYEIAQLAYRIEREDLGLAGGKQDQYAAAFGGFNFMEFYSDRVIVNPLRLKQESIAELESSLVLFYTGVSRDSSDIIQEQTKHVKQGDNLALEALHQVKQEARTMKGSVLQSDWIELAASMRRAWDAKKRMAKTISNPMIDGIYNAACNSGALAGKVSGAGGGGFMMFLVDPEKKPSVIETLGRFQGQVMSVVFVQQGSHSWRVK